MIDKGKNIIAFASDHAGYALKNKLLNMLEEQGYRVLDLGTNSSEVSVDYPDFGFAMGDTISNGHADYGVLVCGSGIGISIAVNRFAKLRAALCHSVETARLAREHNDANVIALGARIIDEKTAKLCVEEFLNTDFAGGRHEKRVKKLETKGQIK